MSEIAISVYAVEFLAHPGPAPDTPAHIGGPYATCLLQATSTESATDCAVSLLETHGWLVDVHLGTHVVPAARQVGPWTLEPRHPDGTVMKIVFVPWPDPVDDR